MINKLWLLGVTSLITVTICLITFPSLAFSQGEISTMKRIDNLENQVESLEEKVSRLERLISKATRSLDRDVARLTEEIDKVVIDTRRMSSQLKAEMPSAVIPADKGNWRKLQLGMYKAQIRQLLGEPDTITKGRRHELWFYAAEGFGSVTFDNEGRVKGWDEP